MSILFLCFDSAEVWVVVGVEVGLVAWEVLMVVEDVGGVVVDVWGVVVVVDAVVDRSLFSCLYEHLPIVAISIT